MHNKLKAFNVITKNCISSEDKYIVIAHNYKEAEDIYWNNLKGVYEILSISLIDDVKDVAYSKADE